MSHPDVEPGIRAYLERIEREFGPMPEAKTIEERRWFTERRHGVWRAPPPDDIAVQDWWIGAEGREVAIRMFRRKDVRRPPVIVYLHGGGFVASSYVTHESITWGMARQTGALVVSVSYRRAPENPYPAAPLDCLVALEWVHNHAHLIDADPTRIAVAGDSAGGCLATVLAAQAIERRFEPLRLQALLYPCVDTRFDRPSMLADVDPMLPVASMRYFWEAYLEGRLETTDPQAVPMRRTSLADLPPAFLVVGEFDPLRDETIAYAERLRADGVPTELRVVPRLIHGFYRARFVSDIARAEFDHLCAALSKALA